MYYIWYNTCLTTLFLVLKNQNAAFLLGAKMTQRGHTEYASFVAVFTSEVRGLEEMKPE